MSPSKSSLSLVSATLVVALLLANCSSDKSSANTGAAPSAPPNSAGSAGKGGALSGGSDGGVSGVAAGVSGGGAGGISGGAGSAGSAGTSETVAASFNTVRDVIAMTPCTGGGCHGAEGIPLYWTPDDPKLYETLTTHVTANCGKLVDTASPADSALIKVLQGDCGTAPNITSRMPYGKCFPGDGADIEACVAPAKVAAIQAWIAKGAPPQ